MKIVPLLNSVGRLFCTYTVSIQYTWTTWPSTRGRLDLAVLFTPSTPNRQNRNQVRWNICAGVRRSTPSFEVVQTEQSRDLFQKRWRIIACMCGYILHRLIYSGVLQSAQFYLFMWLFWSTPSTLKIAKSSPPQVNFTHGWMVIVHCCIILHQINTLSSRLNNDYSCTSKYLLTNRIETTTTTKLIIKMLVISDFKHFHCDL